MKIISGGQTGVDQAALDAAIASGYEHGGWLPAGRLTEDGPLSETYQLIELESPSYPDRTRKNVLEADATLIISRGPLTGGTLLTARIASANNLPHFHVDLQRQTKEEAVDGIIDWLTRTTPAILNVAGPRASSDALIYRESYDVLFALFRRDLNDIMVSSEGKTKMP